MEFGFSLPSRGPAATMQNMRLLAQHVEAVGLDSVWVSDHIVVPRHIDSFYPYDPEGCFPSAPDQAYYEPLTTLAFLAACTTRVQLGTSVLILPYRNALLTAKVVSTLDALSGGRVILGIGVGWMEEEFDALGLDTFHQRGEVSDEYIKVFRTLWTSEQPNFTGQYVRFADIGFAPKPACQPSADLDRWAHTCGHSSCGASGRRLASHWPACTGQPHTPEMREAVARLRDEASQAGRHPQDITISFRAPLAFANDGGTSRQPLTGSPAAIQDDGRYADCGVSHLVFDIMTADVAEMQRVIERFAHDVKTGVRA